MLNLSPGPGAPAGRRAAGPCTAAAAPCSLWAKLVEGGRAPPPSELWRPRGGQWQEEGPLGRVAWGLPRRVPWRGAVGRWEAAGSFFALKGLQVSCEDGTGSCTHATGARPGGPPDVRGAAHTLPAAPHLGKQGFLRVRAGWRARGGGPQGRGPRCSLQGRSNTGAGVPGAETPPRASRARREAPRPPPWLLPDPGRTPLLGARPVQALVVGPAADPAHLCAASTDV